jgi:hypothetical protein
VDWGSELLQILQKVRANCKTRNQLTRKVDSHSRTLCEEKLVSSCTAVKPWSKRRYAKGDVCGGVSPYWSEGQER